MHKEKTFNLLLGSGFSKALAGIKTGIELSNEFFDSFLESKESLSYILADHNHIEYLSLGTSDSRFFQEDSIREFAWEMIQLPFNKAMISIDQSSYEQYVKDEIKRVVSHKIKTAFNYEYCVMILKNYLSAAYVFNTAINETTKLEIQKTLRTIEKKVFDTTAYNVSINEKAKGDFLTFLRYLRFNGYTINVFDLNHDEIFENIIKEDSCFKSQYQDFFDHKDVIKLYKNEEYSGYKFNYELPRKEINHYKLHGDFKILWDEYCGWLKLNNIEKWEFYDNRKWFRPSLLYEGNSKAATIFSHRYHSFGFINLTKYMRPANPLMIVGYGFSDNHINSLIESIYADLTPDFMRENKVTMYLPMGISEEIYNQCVVSSYSFKCNYDQSEILLRQDSENFESGFLVDFKHWIKNYERLIG